MLEFEAVAGKSQKNASGYFFCHILYVRHTVANWHIDLSPSAEKNYKLFMILYLFFEIQIHHFCIIETDTRYLSENVSRYKISF